MNANKTNRGKLLALVAVLAMVFAGAAVMMSDNGVDAAAKDPTYLSGAITATQNYGDGTEVVVTDDLTIPSGMAMIVSGTGKLTVNEGATITIEAGGQLIFQQTDGNNPTVEINGDIVAEGTMPQGYTTVAEEAKPTNAQYFGAIVNNTTNDGETGVFLNGTITLEEGAELIMTDEASDAQTQTPGTNVIAITGITALTDANGDIVLSNGAAINVTKKSSDISIIADQDVMLNEGATLDVNGKINDVTVTSVGTGTYYTTGSVTVNATPNTYDNEEYAKDASDLTFTVTNQSVSAYTTPNDSDSRITLKQFIVNIDGTLAVEDALTVNAGTSVAKGQPANFYTTDKVEISNNKIVGMSSVTGTFTADIGSDVTIAPGAYLNVTGTADFKYDDEATDNGKVTVQGTIAVSGTVNGYILKDKSTFEASGEYRIIVNGGTVALKTDASDVMALYNALGFEPKIYGTIYMIDGETSSDLGTVYITDFDVAITNATAAEVEDVYVIAYGAHMRTTADYAVNNGAPIVDSNVVIPDGMTVTIVNALVVAENGTLMIEDGGEIAFQSRQNTAKLWVEGKVIDYDGIMSKYEDDMDAFIYEVKKTTETDTEEYVTYTTLKIALAEAQPGETIDLHGQIVIDENMTIPEQVTVVTDVDDGEEAAITLVGATLTVNGTLEIKDGATVDLKTNADNNNEADVVVNNIVANADDTTFTYIDDAAYVVDGAYFTGTIGDYEATPFITSAAVAGTNSAAATTDIILMGTINMGDVTFTEGEDNDSLQVLIPERRSRPEPSHSTEPTSDSPPPTLREPSSPEPSPLPPQPATSP